MGRHGTRLGQNFLTDDAAALRIADALGDVSDRSLVEIGPGRGAITDHFVQRCHSLDLIEFDPALARQLAFHFRAAPHVTVHQADILNTDLAALLPSSEQPSLATAAGSARPTLDIIGNLPYYITSDILLHLFAASRAGLLRRAVLMTQREVAQRVAAPPGTRDYGPLSALTQLHGTVTELFTLPPAAFTPPPEVYSTVIRINFAPRLAEFGVDFEGFNRFLRATFAQKRKTLANNLRAAGYPAERLRAVWPDALSDQVRSEAVSLEQLASLYCGLAAEPEAV